MSQEPEEISVLGLAAEFREVHEKMADRAFAFVLGAGASKSSSIRTAGELASDWVKHLHVRSGSLKPCAEWACAEALQIERYDPRDLASAYSALYARLYRNDPAKGYAYLEDQMKNAEPSYGYSVLARILATTSHKVVVTTNFDNLVADSLSIFSTTFPLVCGHESLTAFVRANLRRPLVVKVHRDLLLDPKSTPEDLASLPDVYALALNALFKHYTPIVIGYGGNDGSLMGYLSKLAQQSLLGGVYWCYWGGGPRPNAEIRAFVARQRGYLVAIPGFDELMLLLADALKFDVPDKFVLDRARERATRIVEQVKTLRDTLAAKDSALLDASASTASEAGPRAPGAGNEAESSRKHLEAELASGEAMPAVRRALEGIMERTDGDLRWWQWQELVGKESDPDKREEIYERALRVLPNSAPLHGNFASFLMEERKASDRAEQLYERALELDPHNAIVTGNLANFMTNVRKDYDKAEQLYERALDLDPNNANNHGNFAVFLTDVGKKEYDRAEKLYQRALELNPEEVNWLGNLAFLMLQGGRLERGLELVGRALDLSVDQPPQAVHAECWMYAYCHRPPEQRAEALRQLKALVVDSKIRTGDWDFSGVIKKAVERGHEASTWLPKLAEVLSGPTNPTELEGWEAWAKA